MRTRHIISILIAACALALSATSAQAVNPPSFGSCIFPEGSLRVSYDDGVHGIAGRSAEYRGSDKVYTINADQVMQCFCAPTGEGIQTNWWKIDAVPAEAKDRLVRNGWIYIPNGALWGLDASPYLAYNEEYLCADRGSKIPEILGLANTGMSVQHTLYTIGAGLIAVASVVYVARKGSK